MFNAHTFYISVVIYCSRSAISHVYRQWI